MISKKKKIASIFIALCMMATCVFSFSINTFATSSDMSAAEVAAAASENGLAQNIQDGVILHAWNWDYDTIAENMADIAAAGYSAVQTSPVQQPRDYASYWNEVSTQWWKFYQPLTLSFSNQYTWLGTKSDFEEMCDIADSYGVKVIVDIVANHMANVNEDYGNSANNRNTGIPASIRNNDSYWHVNNIWASDSNRYDMVQGSIGMPDLNTGNSEVQGMVIDLLEECIDAGASGFRFDAAKHIEVPEDTYGAGSNFWPNVIGAAENYASAQKGIDLYCYGEILYTASTALHNYTEYMSITDNQTGENVRDNVINSNAAGAAASGYVFNVGADHSVLWAESHDTYADNTSRGVSDENIRLTWAILASRKDATSLFLGRPSSWSGGVMGENGNNSWQHNAVKEVNKFHNKFIGSSEYLSSSGSVVINERGNRGAVLVNLGNSSANVNATAYRMVDGTYTEHVSGGTFTVENGRIKGTIPAKSIAVIYNDETVSNAKTIYFSNNLHWDQVYAYCFKNTNSNAAWPGVTMLYESTNEYGEDIYSYTFDGTQYDYIIFSNGSGTQTVDILAGSSGTGYYCTTQNSQGKYQVASYTYG